MIGMKSEMIIKWGLCGAATVLAVVGQCFTWKCPLDCVYGVDSGVFFFKSSFSGIIGNNWGGTSKRVVILLVNQAIL
jgi:hypothetical protein